MAFFFFLLKIIYSFSVCFPWVTEKEMGIQGQPLNITEWPQGPWGCLWAAGRGREFLRGGESPKPCRIQPTGEGLHVPGTGDP